MYKEKRIICLGHTINYVDEGSGDIILFLHNGGGFWQIWSKQISCFSSTHRVIALDLPGFGESSESEEAYTLDFYFTIVDEFIRVLMISRVILVGNCIGASIAIKYRSHYPETVSKLILLNICPGERLIPLAFTRWILFRQKSKIIRQIISSVLSLSTTGKILRRWFPRILFGNAPDFNSPLYIKYAKKMEEPKQTRSRIKLLFSSDSFTLRGFLNDSDLTKDALLIWGECNKVATLKKEGYYHQALCGIGVINIIPTGGHLCMYEDPDRTNKLIKNFIGS